MVYRQMSGMFSRSFVSLICGALFIGSLLQLDRTSSTYYHFFLRHMLLYVCPCRTPYSRHSAAQQCILGQTACSASDADAMSNFLDVSAVPFVGQV